MWNEILKPFETTKNELTGYGTVLNGTVTVQNSEGCTIRY